MTGRRIAAALVTSGGASIALIVTYLRGGHPQLEGVLLGISLGGIGWALVVAGHHLFGGSDAVEQRAHLASSQQARREVTEDLAAPVERRGVLVGLFAAALGALAVVLGFPVRSLGGRPGRRLHETAWAAGVRLMNSAGEPITADALEPGSAMTVFPDGAGDAADSIVMLVRVDPGRLRLPGGRSAWAPGGYVAYSKVCTHAGCPVGLFDTDSGLLVCPCHQSSFDVLTGATPRFGPAARPLPQLPLRIEGGLLVAAGEMSHPVGPGFWDLPDGERA